MGIDKKHSITLIIDLLTIFFLKLTASEINESRSHYLKAYQRGNIATSVEIWFNVIHLQYTNSKITHKSVYIYH